VAPSDKHDQAAPAPATRQSDEPSAASDVIADAPVSGSEFVEPKHDESPGSSAREPSVVSAPAMAALVIGEIADAQERVATVARDMLEMQRAIIDNLPDAKVVVDERGTIVLVNHQTELMFGYTREELLGKQVETLLPERFRARHVQHRASYGDDPRTRPMGVELELFGLRKNGRELAVEIMLAPIVISSGTYTIAIIRRRT
jgi:PAS domain S-box-containing protein